MISLTINDKKISVPEGFTILQAANEIGVHIPTLCHLYRKETGYINRWGTCRVCMVEAVGRRNLLPACSTNVVEGMEIKTTSRRAVTARRTMVELFLSNHPKDCLVCEKNRDCELQALAAELGVRDVKYEGHRSTYKKDTTSASIVRNPEKCILCRRCETMCNEVQTVGVYSAVHRGFDTVMGTALDSNMIDTPCVFCGQCVTACPTAALTEVDNTAEVWEILSDPDLFVVAQTAPAVRAALGESFSMEHGSVVTGKMAAALRRLGFSKVLDTNFAADLTIIEEASELIHRIKNGGRLPMLTSCCPAWVKFMEDNFPDLLDVPSTCKSPHEMFGAIAKTYLAEKLGVAPEKMRVVSIMPCLAKKYEAKREELIGENKLPDVDFVLSTRELARMIKESGIAFNSLPDEDFDEFMGESAGAGVIFGTAGGVTEATLRTANVWLGGSSEQVEYKEIRGSSGIRKADVTIGDGKIRVAIANGLGNARALLNEIRAGTNDFEMLEIMACPAGCVGGGGQPYHRNSTEILKARTKGIFTEDKNKKLRFSHENPEVLKLYEEFLGEFYGEKAHKLLHTSYGNKAEMNKTQ